MGVCGIWSDMVREGLEEVLPMDAHTRCSGKVHIIVSRFRRPPLVVSTFESRQDLIECLMATTHVPFFMNFLLFRVFREWWCYDGGWSLKTNEDYEVLGSGHAYHHFDYQHDETCTHNSLRACGTDVFKDMARTGYEFAKKKYG